MDTLLDLAFAPGAGAVTRASTDDAPDEDAALVAAARNGGEPAFERLYRRFAPLVHGVLIARVPRANVDDLVQEVFLTVFRRLSTLRVDAAFPGWLCAIARARAVDFHRSQPATVRLGEKIESAEGFESEALAALEALRDLPDAYRETLALRLVEGMTGPEIARRTGLSPGSVRVNLHRGMALLRAALGVERPTPRRNPENE